MVMDVGSGRAAFGEWGCHVNSPFAVGATGMKVAG